MKKSLFKLYYNVTRFFKGTGLSEYHILNLLHLYIHSKLKSNFVYVFGSKLFLDKNDLSAFSIGDFSQDYMISLFEKEIHKGDTVIDIGAHIGLYTLVFAKLVGENGQVFAFEPDPTNFKVLQKNVQVNGLKNVIIEQKAVGEKCVLVKLVISDYTTKITEQNSNGQSVECIKIDDYFQNYHKKISFVKIDAEGSEVKILRGMTNFLQKNKTVKILTEYYPKLISEAGTNPEELPIRLLNNGFRIFDLTINNGKLALITTNPDTLSKNYDLKSSLTNLFCTREIK